MIRSRIPNRGKVRNNAFIFRTDTNEECRNSIVDMVNKMRGRGYSIDDIQVICPQKKTDVGINSLNYFIQEALNPSHGGKEVLSRVIQVRDRDGKIREVKLMLREGDKVINTSNNYSMKFFNFRRGEGFIEDYTRVGIVNGETGRIAKIVDVKANGKPHQRVYVRYGEDQYAMYEDTWDELTLAYAMTIHRAQGSQWPVIIAPVMLCNRIMLNRKLFYTLYTRAQESCIIFGTPEAIQYAINNDTSAKRNTWLKQRLSEK